MFGVDKACLLDFWDDRTMIKQSSYFLKYCKFLIIQPNFSTITNTRKKN